jgi:hypothetical protein
MVKGGRILCHRLIVHAAVSQQLPIMFVFFKPEMIPIGSNVAAGLVNGNTITYGTCTVITKGLSGFAKRLIGHLKLIVITKI